jgi:hypothetical protein
LLGLVVRPRRTLRAARGAVRPVDEGIAL